MLQQLLPPCILFLTEMGLGQPSIAGWGPWQGRWKQVQCRLLPQKNIRLSPRWTYLKWKYCIKVCNFLLMQISIRFSTLVVAVADCWSWARAAPSTATNAMAAIGATKLCNCIAILISCFSNDGVLKSYQPFTKAKVLICNFLSWSVLLFDVRLFG